MVPERMTETYPEESAVENKACIGFYMKNPYEAYFGHMDTEIVEEYGDTYQMNQLHIWQYGGRRLLRCKKCGGYILCQYSEYHGIEFDEYSQEYFPVSGPEEARDLNAKYNGYQIIMKFPGRWLSCDPCRAPYWFKLR